MYLINTILGFLIAQIYGLLTRSKNGKFNIWFFIKDTWQKILLSLILSISLSAATYFNYIDIFKLFGSEINELNALIYLVIGAVPEMVLQVLRKRFGVLYGNDLKAKSDSIGGGGIKNPPGGE